PHLTHSFPTRRSSDLWSCSEAKTGAGEGKSPSEGEHIAVAVEVDRENRRERPPNGPAAREPGLHERARVDLAGDRHARRGRGVEDRKSTRLNSSHSQI